MVTLSDAPVAADVLETRVSALVLVTTGPSRFAALAFEGDTIVETLSGHGAGGEAHRLSTLATGRPIVTDQPRRALDLLVREGVASPLIWDVLELASLLAPACPTASLAQAAEYFGIVLTGERLADQAQRAHMLFQLLVATIERVETQTLLHTTRLAAGLDWPLRRLFADVQQKRAISPLEHGALAEGAPIGTWITHGLGPRKRGSANPAPADPDMLDEADVVGRLAPDADIAAALSGFEPRAEQLHMARLVTEALNEGGELLVEAGTGTGKSLAYLLPAALRAVRAGQRALISTATTTLQDQLFEHDLPLVQVGLRSEQPLRATVLKGRANYLCLRRWQLLLHAGDLSPADRMLLIKTLYWLPRTTTGDRAELHLSPAEQEAWNRLSAVTEACTPLRCQYHRIGVCFLARARRAAEESHIVVANHALLLSDLASRSRVLPDYDILVVDEAHHLEDEATQQLGWRLGERELLTRLERLWSPGSGATGAVPEALALLSAANGLLLPPALRPTLADAEQSALQLATAVRRFFEALARVLEDPDVLAANGQGAEEQSVRLTAAIRAGSTWQELEHLWAAATSQLELVERAIIEVVAELEGLPGAPDAARDLAAELGGHLDFWRDTRRRLNQCVHQPDASTVHWISGGGRFRTAWLNAAPLEVASLLRERLFPQAETTILVSATLTIGGSFDYVKRRLGLDDARAVALGSPFDYQQAALLYVPNDLPDPTQSGYQRAVERAIMDTVTRVGGRTLVLFTSRAHLRATYQALREPLAAERITLLAQGIDEGSRTRLLDAFRRGTRVVLFGTNAFWEGIDVVGDALSCVMVTRLPFAVPSDPIYAARAEQFDDPFRQFAVPQAVLRLKQGFGRLIRSRADRGAVVVLDRRLVTRYYGQVFVRSLPPCTVRQGPLTRTGVEAVDWLALAGLDPTPMQQALSGVE